jgi:hypothetical protein
MSAISSAATSRRALRHRSPSLLAVAIVSASLFVASLIVTAAMTHGAHFPSPFVPARSARVFFADHTDAVRLGAFLQFGAAIPLAIFTATASSRLRFLGIEAAGASIAMIGGMLASAMAALSALTQWSLAQPDLEGEVRGLHLLAFATGGPGFVVPFGLLIAGVAVSGGLSRKIPRWAMGSGIAVAAVAELSSLTLAVAPVMILLPIARFAGFAWIIVAGAALPTTRDSPRR